MKNRISTSKPNDLALKKHLYETCMLELDQRIMRIRHMLDELKSGAANDAKSSAGDKHETAISMMQLEQEKLNKKLHELAKQKDAAEKLAPLAVSEKVTSGSLVITAEGIFYLLSAVGKVNIGEMIIQCISPQAPLAMALLGKKAGDEVTFMNRSYKIDQVI